MPRISPTSRVEKPRAKVGRGAARRLGDLCPERLRGGAPSGQLADVVGHVRRQADIVDDLDAGGRPVSDRALAFGMR
jgi:hypothetical protein